MSARARDFAPPVTDQNADVIVCFSQNHALPLVDVLVPLGLSLNLGETVICFSSALSCPRIDC